MKTRVLIFCFAAVVLFLGAGVPAVAGPLADYVNKPDASYAFTMDKTLPGDGHTIYTIKMTSQTWKDIPWWHWVSIIKPDKVDHPETALLFIAGGDNDERPAPVERSEAKALAFVATRLNAVVAMLNQVPNQPLFDGKFEDGIIALTFEQFLKTGDAEWPLLLPMTKSAVRAMDTIQAVAQKEFGQEIKRFMVAGGSKRGWTTWLTAVADPRVVSIAPMVIDVLNMGPQMAYQKKVYGTYSDQVKDYTDRGLQESMQNEEGKKLLQIVDPYEYRDQLTLPKLVVLGTNDEYWCVDSAKFYFGDLKGDSWLHYEPNAPHGLNLNVVPVIMAMFNSTITGKKLPAVTWKRADDGALEVAWDNPAGKPVLWQAVSPNRDFRQALWTGTPLESPSPARVTVTAPESGWRAYFVSVEFPLLEGVTYPLSTMMTVVPDTFPEH
ncbi:MAG TPA: PhoPQ-activated protein PqaA family protein [Candidatus Bathyarchaeia archaeon]|nr:PhoPQ-activated protein PqaA family protein [Candidatus Bathyarchaeia archaeon]